jgi:hypothetical protein
VLLHVRSALLTRRCNGLCAAAKFGIPPGAEWKPGRPPPGRSGSLLRRRETRALEVVTDLENFSLDLESPSVR